MYREKASWWSFSLINWHCWRPMQRVFNENRGLGKEFKAWICPHCHHRKYYPSIVPDIA